ncbi:MAG: efflux RND transporter periplasmic adaptor subunit [Clostridiales bacterium]|nr:efflux RND transporter periplasmic adaptor subunit [Clostridiales bacterium]
MPYATKAPNPPVSAEYSPGNKKYLRRLIAAAASCILALSLAGCAAVDWINQNNNAVTYDDTREQAPLPVAVSPATREDMSRALTLGGLLKPMEEVALMGGGAGSRVLEVAVSVGDYVEKGQVILTQDMRDLQIQEQNLRISKGQLQESLDIQKQNLDLSRTQLQESYDKSRALYEVGAAAESQLTALENQIQQLDLQAEGQLTALENQIKQIDLQLETLRINRDKMAVTSTINGVISALPVVEGQMAAASTMVAMVVNIDKLLLDVQVGESYIMGVRKGDEMEILIPSFGERTVKGRVRSIPPNINPQTRAYTVTLEVDNPERLIKGGMYGETKLVVDRVENVLVIPQYAVLKLDDGLVVFVEENGIAVKKPVSLGLTLGNQAQVLEGLNEGDKVIVEGQYAVTEGREVSVVGRGADQ